ncbi:MAG: gluconate 2-dehydrogenase subunit 3 family protein [Terriglobales bacterium]
MTHPKTQVAMGQESYSRRSAVKHLALLMASAAGQEFLAGWLPSTNVLAAGSPNIQGMHHIADVAKPSSPYVPQFFKPQEFSNIEILTEMIIPHDDKPGAKDARVAEYIDFLVFSSVEFQPGLQRDWTDGLALLEQLCQKEFGRAFAELGDAQRHNLMTSMSLPEVDPHARHEGFAFFRLLKETTVEGFYTSRPGLIDTLEYQGLTYLAEFPGCTHPEHQS